MTREILFRGQTRRFGEKVNTAGEKQPSRWVYGGIFPGTGDFSVIYGAEKEDFTGADIEKWTVYSDTVGQYTGLKDKNGKRIYEGDILTCGVCRCIVRYGEFNCSCCHGVYGWYFDGGDIRNHKDYEIIGNIHDELIGGNDGT